MTGSLALTPACSGGTRSRAEEQGDKEERGRVLVVAGSPEVPGAALLAANAVMRAGVGKVQLAVPASIALSLAVAIPEAQIFSMQRDSGRRHRSGTRRSGSSRMRAIAGQFLSGPA